MIVVDSCICYILCQSFKLLVICNKVCLATKTYKNCLLVVCSYLCNYRTLCCLTVGAFCGNKLTLLADHLFCLLIVSVCLYKRLLAIHHSGTCHLTKLCNVCCFNFHCKNLLNC